MKQFIIFLGVGLLLFAARIEASIFPIVNTTSVCTSKSPCQLLWTNDANDPPVAKLPKTTVQLMVGPDSNQIKVLDLGTVTPKVGKIVYNISPTLGPPGKYYFYKFTPLDMDPIWSARFTIQDIQGNITGFDPSSINGSGQPTDNSTSTGGNSASPSSNSTTTQHSIASPVLSANIAIGLSMAAIAAVYLY